VNEHRGSVIRWLGESCYGKK